MSGSLFSAVAILVGAQFRDIAAALVTSYQVSTNFCRFSGLFSFLTIFLVHVCY